MCVSCDVVMIKMARRRSRNAVVFNVIPILEAIERLALEIEDTFRDGNIAYDRIHGFQLRLSDAVRNVQHLSHLLGRERHDNIVDGLQDMLRSLREMTGSMDCSTSYHAEQRPQG